MAAVEEVWQPRDFCLYCAGARGAGARTMPIFSRLMFQAVHWAARPARRREFFQRCEKAGSPAHRRARRNLCIPVFAETGVHIRSPELHSAALRVKSIFSVTMARRWHLWKSERAPSERTCRRCRNLSISREKQHVVVHTAQRFMVERHVGKCPCRFDVMAIDNCPGQPPVVRLRRDACSPQS